MAKAEETTATVKVKTETPVPAPAATIRVKDIKSGQTGTIPASEFDAKLYMRIK